MGDAGIWCNARDGHRILRRADWKSAGFCRERLRGDAVGGWRRDAAMISVGPSAVGAGRIETVAWDGGGLRLVLYSGKRIGRRECLRGIAGRGRRVLFFRWDAG